MNTPKGKYFFIAGYKTAIYELVRYNNLYHIPGVRDAR